MRVELIEPALKYREDGDKEIKAEDGPRSW